MEIYTIHPGVTYCVDLFDVKLFNSVFKKSITLLYPQAAIWDFIVKQYSRSTMIYLLTKIGIMTPTHAEAVVGETLEYLAAEQILVKE